MVLELQKERAKFVGLLTVESVDGIVTVHFAGFAGKQLRVGQLEEASF